MKRAGIQNQRFYVQVIFSLLCVWIGIEFYLFIRFFETNGISSYYQRPPGVEGFLPISSLMNVLYFFKTGIIHPVHPAGFFIFIAIIAVSITVGKSFCGWLCPIGLLSEKLGDFGQKIMKRKFILPFYLDYFLRSIKYFLLGFLVYFLFSMTTEGLKAFLDGGYNLVADIKMYYFFAHITLMSLIVILSFLILSVFIRNFWCRFLCPYGALLCIAGILSPLKIKRNTTSCIDCGKCAKVCPSNIKVDKIKMVISDECTSCLKCIDSCPISNTLLLKPIAVKKTVPGKMVLIIVVGLFVFITGFAMITGNWQNKISKQTYVKYYKLKDTFKHH